MSSTPRRSLLHWFGADDTWQRTAEPVGRRDVLLAAWFTLFGFAALELTRGFSDYRGARPRWAEYLALVAMMSLVVWRRVRPLAVLAVSTALFVTTGFLVPEVAYGVGLQSALFFLYFSAVAWARDRRLLVVTLAAVVLSFVAWLTWAYAWGSAMDDLTRQQEEAHGWLPPVTSSVLFSTLLNSAYIWGATVVGQSAWREARTRDQLAEQAATIREQATRLRDQAVVDERLRIARELHDVVAHHVSVMGIQAAGARRVLGTRPDQATAALTAVEDASRQAVTEMRSLLGTLRGSADGVRGDTDQNSSAPEPSLADLPALLDSHRTGGLQVDYHLVERAPGAASQLPLPVQLSMFRTAQEALANVRRHSTATRATLTVRVDQDAGGTGFAEVEVLDAGRPRSGTSGTGLGLLGVRERVGAHGGSAEIGPRVSGGYRVRVRFPARLSDGPATLPERAVTSSTSGRVQPVAGRAPAALHQEGNR